MRMLGWVMPAAWLVAAVAPALGNTVTVGTTDELRNAINAAAPGDTIFMRGPAAGGVYSTRLWVQDRNGTALNPIRVLAANPADRPVFTSDTQGCFSLYNCSYFIVDGIIGEHGGTASVGSNNIEFAQSEHMVLRNSLSRWIDNAGNSDAFKFASTNNMLMYGCKADSWSPGGSAVDIMNNHNSLFMRNTITFPGSTGSAANGFQPKGDNAYQQGFYKNYFVSGPPRCQEFGGSSGATGWEGRNMVCMGSVFDGGDAAVAYTSCTTSDFAYNTIKNPTNWVMRILNGNPGSGAAYNTAYNTFSRNLVKYTISPNNVQNVGANTQPATFTYADNFWSQTPVITGTETGRVVGEPNLNADYRPLNTAARDYGAHAPGMEAAWAPYTPWFDWAWTIAQNYDPSAAAATTAKGYKIYKHGSEGGSLALNGTASYAGNNPFVGVNANYHQNVISNYTWDVNGDNVFGDAAGSTPALSYAQLTALGRGAVGTYLAELGITVDTDYDDIKDWSQAALVVAEAHPGDFTFDGIVNVDDLGILASNYDGSGKNWTTGDASDDGAVNVDDLGILASNYDWVDPAGSPVPEPASLGLLLAGALALRRRQ